MAKRSTYVFALVATLLAVSAGAAALYFGGAWIAGPAVDAQHIARGRALYQSHCASCHGANLEGQANWQQRGADGLLPAPPHDETGHTWHHSDEQILQITKYGTAALVGGGYQSAMIGFGDRLSDDDLRAIIDFIKSNWPEGIRQRQAEITERARAAP